jgi:DNA-binding NarL/FixJ family response regulator
MLAPSRLRALIVADGPREPATLRDRIETDGIIVCGEARDRTAAIGLAIRERPDLCVIHDAPPLDAIATAAAVCERAPDVRVVLIGPQPDDQTLLAAVATGACGYLPLETPAPRLVAALRDVVAGLPAFPRRLEVLLVADVQGRARPR